MRAVVQRVKDCRVEVEQEIRGQIDYGLLVYLGVGREDTEEDMAYLADKIASLRIFPDAQDKMNLSASDIGAEILVVSQFTLYGDARKGRRPSYSSAAEPNMAAGYYHRLVELLQDRQLRVETGEFAARMQVTYTNDGPVTLLLDSKKQF